MKFLIIFLPILLTVVSFGQNQTDLLSSHYSEDELTELLIPQSDWSPFPKISDREAWQAADQEMFKAFLTIANNNIDYNWPSIPATKSLLFERTGDRDEYQSVSFEKRRILGTMILAEIYENKGRFIDPIINGIWSICEESWWGVPAHLPKTKHYSGLMDVSEPFVDLFAAETATYLAWADYFLGNKFDAISPQIRQRIYFETNTRIFKPLMTVPHWWMSTDSNGTPPNNWNPWICSNWINAVLLLEKDPEKRITHVSKILNVLDEFLNPYPQDGGCDEGPGYWGAAAASLFDNLAMLNLATNNQFKFVYSDEKIKNMARFIYRAQISEKYFLNFADADPQPKMDADMIFRFGKAIGEKEMENFGAFYKNKVSGEIGTFQYFRNLFSLFMQEKINNSEKKLPLPQSVWLPNIQVMISRDNQGSSDGFFVAAKGGHNNESHNHNDIGNYVVYYNGLPLLIDVGRGTYTRKTFSDKRYEIWSNCSDYHNLPTINGHTQLQGVKYAAKNAIFKTSDKNSLFLLDLKNAYPEEAGINVWQRSIKHTRGTGIEITDAVNLNETSKITQHMMTSLKSEIIEEGKVLMHSPEQDFIIRYNPKQMEAYIEKIKLTAMEDKGIIQKWGNSIYRINFNITQPKNTDRYTFNIIKKE